MQTPPIAFEAPGRQPAQALGLRGFTMVELMVTLAVLAVLATIAAPSFTSLMENWRVRQATEELQGSLYFARSEAIKRSGGITIKPDDGDDWGQGWTVGAAGSETLQITPAHTRIVINASGGPDEITVDRWGAFSPAPTFTITPQDKTTPARTLTVNLGGSISQQP